MNTDDYDDAQDITCRSLPMLLLNLVINFLSDENTVFNRHCTNENYNTAAATVFLLPLLPLPTFAATASCRCCHAAATAADAADAAAATACYRYSLLLPSTLPLMLLMLLPLLHQKPPIHARK
jgi:hypothetical protein